MKTLADDRVRFLGGVWDQDLLDQLYAHSTTYLHGHSVGGTNPSLLRAIGAAAPTTAFDVSFNREVLLDNGRYFSTPADVAHEIDEAEAHPAATRARGVLVQRSAHRYDWDEVAGRYEDLCVRLAASRRRTWRRVGRPSGRRHDSDAGAITPGVGSTGDTVARHEAGAGVVEKVAARRARRRAA